MSSRTSRGVRPVLPRATRESGGNGLGPAFERSPAAQIAVHPRDGTLRAINSRARVLLEISDHATVELRADRFWVQGAEFFQLLEAVDQSGEHSALEARLQTLNGRPFWSRLDATRVEDLVLISLQDVGAYKRETEALRGLAQRDSLTGLPNRRAYQDAAEVAVRRSRAHGTSLCLAVFDVDHFKRVNDSLGHPVGDRVLVHLANLARNRLRRSDFIARYGGEEFVILMPDTELAEAAKVLDRLRQIIANAPLLRREETDTRATVSVGVAALSESDSVEDLLARADSALYRAKQAGRNRVEI